MQINAVCFDRSQLYRGVKRIVWGLNEVIYTENRRFALGGGCQRSFGIAGMFYSVLGGDTHASSLGYFLYNSFTCVL